MTRSLIIVESPAKARTIARYLGSDFDVESSIGHIRDLPSSAAEIPKQHKDKPWARLGVDVEEDFRPLYVVPPSKKSQVAKLRAKLKNADTLYLATDEDREGEAIAWHLVEVLKPSCPVRRMVFHEITQAAVERALEATREIDDRMVSAQETRRILDRLVGYEVSPLLWKKLKTGLSAGRVQSVATRLVVAREAARMAFREADYCGLDARLAAGADIVAARLAELGGRRVATGKDFDPDTGEPKGGKLLVLSDERATRLAGRLEGATFEVAEVTEKPFTSRPYPPFMTSTLQQEAGRKLRFNAQRTMRVAQNLYENGFITYMRTDSTTLSSEAINAARNQVRELYGDRFVPERPRVYASRSKNAQEAHEAIRPAGDRFLEPAAAKRKLDGDQYRLYELIWKRTLASQMPDAHGRRTTVRIEADGGDDDGSAVFTTAGRVIDFAGFLRAYVEGSDDPEAELADQEKILPQLERGQRLAPRALEVTHHTTQPPPRFTEASLVKELETRGIGRPSTYATIIQTIQDRGYVWHKGPALVPTFTAFAVVKLLEQNLPDLVDYDFTAKMEDELDTIARGERDAVPWLKDFYFGGNRTNGGPTIVNLGLKKLVDSTVETLVAREASRIVIGSTDDGREIAVRIGRYGAFVQLADTDRRASVPDDLPPDELTTAAALALLERAEVGERPLGHDPASGQPVYLKSGRFGAYVQLGDAGDGKGAKPKMASLWPTMSPDDLSLEDAVMLLTEFPREVGVHPDSGEPITAQDGRYGPYLKMGSETRSLANHEQLRDVTLPEAVALFKQPKGGRSQRSETLAELGTRPGSEDAVSIRTGRFGPYVTDGTVNASVPKGRDPATVTLEAAVELLVAREKKLLDQGKDPRAKKTRSPRKPRATTKTTPGSGTKKKSTTKKK